MHLFQFTIAAASALASSTKLALNAAPALSDAALTTVVDVAIVAVVAAVVSAADANTVAGAVVAAEGSAVDAVADAVSSAVVGAAAVVVGELVAPETVDGATVVVVVPRVVVGYVMFFSSCAHL